jgi:hypothetical protein
MNRIKRAQTNTLQAKGVLLVAIKAHGGHVDLQNSFDHVWTLLSKAGDTRLKTSKKKTHFVARASIVTPKGPDEGKKAIVFLRQIGEHRKLQETATCFECCWGPYYTCHSRRIGMYSKALDKWASSSRRQTSSTE